MGSKYNYWDEQPPAHFHVEYGEWRAQIDLDNLQITEGYVPKSQYRKVAAWAAARKAQLLDAWIKCRSDVNPGKIR